MKSRIGVLLGLALATQVGATVRYFHWDKPHHGDRGNVTALDLASRKVLWEASAGNSVNFVNETADGILVGNDRGEVLLLDKATGKLIWRCSVEKKAEVKRLVAETEEGYFIGSGDEFFWLVSRDGKLLLRCNDVCAPPK